jgi:CBS domain-containing protein
MVSEALERLRAHRIHHLLICEGKDLVGVVSDRDLLGRDGALRVREVMVNQVVTIEPADTLRKAAGLMEGHEIGSLAVVHQGQLAGIISTSDLVRALAKGDTHPAPPAERMTLRKRGPRKRAQQVI